MFNSQYVLHCIGDLNFPPYFSFIELLDILFFLFLGGNEGEGPLVVFLHGGGYSGLTWAPLNEALTRLVKCQTLAIDLRGHGCSISDDENDLSAETMAKDISDVIEDHVKSLETHPEVVLIGV